MLAKWANIVFGDWIAFIDVATDFAHPTFFAFGVRLRFDVGLIISVGHCFYVGNDSCFGHGADEHSVSVKVNIFFNLQ